MRPQTDGTVQWLLAGDPAIRWQTLRDLVGAAERTVERERGRVARDGWGARLLARQDARCPLCGDLLLRANQPPESPDQRERWWLHLARKAIAADYLVHNGRPGQRSDETHTRLIHASCRRGHSVRRPRP